MDFGKYATFTQTNMEQSAKSLKENKNLNNTHGAKKLQNVLLYAQSLSVSY